MKSEIKVYETRILSAEKAVTFIYELYEAYLFIFR